MSRARTVATLALAIANAQCARVVPEVTLDMPAAPSNTPALCIVGRSDGALPPPACTGATITVLPSDRASRRHVLFNLLTDARIRIYVDPSNATTWAEYHSDATTAPLVRVYPPAAGRTTFALDCTAATDRSPGDGACQ